MDAVAEFARARPADPLQPYVAGYSGYREAGGPPTRHRGLPSPYLTLIFTLDDPLVIARHVDPTRAPGTYDALLGGLHTTAAIVTHDGRQSGVQLALRPLGARALLGLPAGELAGLDEDASAVLGPFVDRVRAALVAAPTWTERFAALDRLLLGRLRDAPPVAPEIAHTWQCLLRSGGRAPIGAIVDEIGWSQRHLATRFRHETGLTPKAAARVVRFDRTRRALVGWNGSLAELAAHTGFYDQPHLIREFHALAGCAPSQWLTEEFGNIQSGRWAGGPD